MKKITVSKAIREGLLEEMRRDDKMFIMGEDMAVMGNVFAITTGFLDEFGPNRVIDTPISEEGFMGMAVGAAMRGMHPCVELMYDDFVTECADPLFNQAAKLKYMSGGQCSIPLVLRMPMGSGRRNAGQHSQSLEGMVCHFPGLKVVAPSCAEDAKGLIKASVGAAHTELKPFAKRSVLIFLVGVIFVVLYASAISPAVGLIENVVVGRDAAIMSLMLIVGMLITMTCNIEIGKIADSSVFKSGMVAIVCVLGVAWLGDTFVSGHSNEIKELAAGTVSETPALLAVVFFLASMLLYSQAATAKAITPAIVAALGISAANPGDSYMLVASFAAVSALFVLPTYPTLLGAVQMDYTGTTRIGKFVFNHAFFLPGLIAIVFAVALGFLACSLVG